MHSLLTFLRLTKADKKLFTISLFYIFFFSIFRKILSLRKLLSLIKFQKTNNLKNQCISPDNINLFFENIFLKIYSPSCLVKSLAIKKIFNIYGIKSDLIIGVKKNRNLFESHAWVQINNKLYVTDNSIIDYTIIHKTL